MVVRAMVLGWLDGLFTSIHERVLYPSHRLGGGEGRRWEDVNPRRLSFTVYLLGVGAPSIPETGFPGIPLLGSLVNKRCYCVVLCSLSTAHYAQYYTGQS